MTPQEERRKQYEKVAHMKIMGTPQVQIAEVMGFADHTRISQIVSDPYYQEIEAALRGATLDQTKAFNDGWDGLEANAIDNLATIMKYNKDPELMLRVAAVANKARRRGGYGPPPPIPGGQAQRANMSLPAGFVTLIQQNGGTLVVNEKEVRQIDKPEQKHNIMAPGQVQKLFAHMSKETDILGGALDGIDPDAINYN